MKSKKESQLELLRESITTYPNIWRGDRVAYGGVLLRPWVVKRSAGSNPALASKRETRESRQTTKNHSDGIGNFR